MNENEWLANLQIGDKVYIPGDYGRFGALCTVERFTNTQILVRYNDRVVSKFRRDDGRSIGRDTWHTQWLKPVTEETYKQQRMEALHGRFASIKNSLSNPRKISEEHLSDCVEMLECVQWLCRSGGDA